MYSSLHATLQVTIRSFLIAAVALAAFATSTPLHTSAVSGCGSGDHPWRWWSIGINERTNYGGFVQSHQQNYEVNDASAGHWVIYRLLVGFEQDWNWIEVGYGWGWEGQDRAHWYHAHVPESTGDYDESLIQFAPEPANVNSWHNYQISTTSDPNDWWWVYLDNQAVVGSNPAEFPKPALDIEAGGEMNNEHQILDITYAENHQFRTGNNWWFWGETGVSCVSDRPLRYEWLDVGSEARFWGP